MSKHYCNDISAGHHAAKHLKMMFRIMTGNGAVYGYPASYPPACGEMVPAWPCHASKEGASK